MGIRRMVYLGVVLVGVLLLGSCRCHDVQIPSTSEGLLVPLTITIPHSAAAASGSEAQNGRLLEFGVNEVSSVEFAQFLNDIKYYERGKGTPVDAMTFSKCKLNNDPCERFKDVYVVESSETSVRRTRKGFVAKEGMPINWVTYYGAVAYCDWLSKKTGETYGLPSESEWEMAAEALGLLASNTTAGVWEWCADLESDLKGNQPLGYTILGHAARKERRIVRGGAVIGKLGGGIFDEGLQPSTVKSRGSALVLGTSVPNIGFRIVKLMPVATLPKNIEPPTARMVQKLIRDENAAGTDGNGDSE